MKVAHLIMAYKNPIQLERLVKCLNHPGFDIYIHLDKKIDIKKFQFINKQERVFFIMNRKVCNWGGFSFVIAITNSLREILTKEVKYDYVNLLSGQDYPIKPNDHFYEYLKRQKGKSFISYDKSSNSDWWQHAVTRYEHYHFTDINIKGRYVVQGFLNRYMPKRKFPLAVKLYGSSVSSWWTITQPCAQYIVDFLDTNKKLLNFMKFTWAADEFLYATIIMNSPFRDKTINNNLRHIEWIEGKPNPKIFSKKDFETLKSSKSFFARKFDFNEDTQIVLLLDELISTSDSKNNVSDIRRV